MDEQLNVVYGEGLALFFTPAGAVVFFRLTVGGQLNAGSRQEFNPLKLSGSATPSTERCEALHLEAYQGEQLTDEQAQEIAEGAQVIELEQQQTGQVAEELSQDELEQAGGAEQGEG